MPNGNPPVFGLPCRFPAAPSIRPKDRSQGFDHKRLSDARRASKKFLPCVSRRGRERERRRYPAVFVSLARRADRPGRIDSGAPDHHTPPLSCSMAGRLGRYRRGEESSDDARSRQREPVFWMGAEGRAGGEPATTIAV